MDLRQIWHTVLACAATLGLGGVDSSTPVKPQKQPPVKRSADKKSDTMIVDTGLLVFVIKASWLPNGSHRMEIAQLVCPLD